MNSEFQVIEAGPGDTGAIKQLLLKNKLPVEDLEKGAVHFLVSKSGDGIAGVIGIENYKDTALLRSMATAEAYRNRGIATKLVNELEHYAGKQGIKTVYLLTLSAEKYFEKKGYTKIDRNEAPASIQASAEFSHLCPSSAVVMKKEISQKKRILFVCVENSNRSQMSQAFAKLLGGDAVESYSAGSKPSGVVNPKAIASMKELGYDLSAHDSKSLQEVEQFAPFDAVVTMGCGDACPWMPAKKFIDWQIPDPRNMEEADFRQVRDLIKEKVAGLLKEL